MKKKIFYGILFFAILAINVISVSTTDVRELSLTKLMQTAKADGTEWSGVRNWLTGDRKQKDLPHVCTYTDNRIISVGTQNSYDTGVTKTGSEIICDAEGSGCRSVSCGPK